MKKLLTLLALVALVSGMLFATARDARAEQTGPAGPLAYDPADPIIDNGSLVQLGINPAGHFNVPGGTPSMPSASTTNVGLRYIPTNGEATAPGCLCEGWGVANADGATGSFSGYANVSSDGGVVNLAVVSTSLTNVAGKIKAESVGSEFKSITTSGDISGARVEVTQDYHPSSSPNLYQVDVTIKNIGLTSLGDARYRRVMDWDISPFTFSEFVEIHVGTAVNLVQASTNGFSSANPLASAMPFPIGSPPTVLVSGSPDYFGGPSDQGALFDFTFGLIAPGASKSFVIYYGAAKDKTEALAALVAVGAQVYSLGIPRHADGTASPEGPHVFIFAFGKVGGTPVGGDERRMTGGGSIGTSGARHGFELHCDAATAPNRLEVNWGKGNKFHLEALTTAACSDDPLIASPNPPTAGFDTYKGKGMGRYNGVSGATAEWIFTDAGEPGKNDIAKIVIKDAGGNTVLAVSGNLANGNHQAHAK